MKTLIISLCIGVLVGSMVWAGCATIRHRETTPNAYNADTGTWVHIEKDSDAAPGTYRITHPGWFTRHAAVTGFVAGDIAALVAWIIFLLIASFMKPTTPPDLALELLPDAGIRLLPPLPR